MSVDWGTPPWRIEVDQRRAVLSAPAPLPSRAAAIVIGGGLTGLSAARGLARRAVEVALLEAATIGAGASGRTGGLVLEHTAAGPLDAVSDCLPFLAEVVAEERIACDLDLRGCWEVEHRPRPDAATDGRGGLRWRDGDRDLVVSNVVAGGTVDAGALVSGLASAALRAGAAIHERAEVVRLATGRPSTVVIRGPAGERTVAADRVLVALNAYTPAIVPLAADLVPSLTMALATEPLDAATLAAIGLEARLPFYTADLPYLWGRILRDGRAVFGAGLAFDPERRIERVGIGSGEAHDALARLESRVRGLHPALATVAIERRWGGPIAFRTGRTPLLARHPGSADVIVAGGYAGHGIALAVRVGDLGAAALTGERPLPEWGAFAT